MTVNKLSMWLAACFFVTTQASSAFAQLGMLPLLQEDAFCQDCCEHDLQFFSPVDFDFDCQPITKDCGWFFRFDKLSWAASGESTVIGDNSLNVQSEVIFRQTAFTEGTAPQTFRVLNSIQDAPPAGDFGWGERYEFGRRSSGSSGWFIGILDGPAINTREVYGFNHVVIPNTLPLDTRPNDADVAPGITPFFGLGPNDLSTSRNGFGSVFVNFATPADYLLGLRDYHINGPNNESGPTVGGPGRVLVPATVVTTVVDGTLTEVQITTAAVVTGADGLPDDLDGDGTTFFFIFTDTNMNGAFDMGEPIIANGVDFDDLHQFNVAFDTLIVRNFTETQGIELMHTVELDNSHKMKKWQHSKASIAYGVRYLQLDDEFYWEGRGGVLGLTFANNEVQNSIVGPQIRGKWHTQQGRWGLDLDGRFTWGYNIQDQDQYGLVGQDLVPGGINRPVTATPNAVRNGRNDETFSPIVEFRAEGTYNFTSSIAFRLGYTATFIDNVTRASQTQVWSLPNLGLRPGGNQDIFINGANFGFDVTY